MTLLQFAICWITLLVIQATSIPKNETIGCEGNQWFDCLAHVRATTSIDNTTSTYDSRPIFYYDPIGRTRGRCILNQWLCDGERDCFDGVDEQNCKAISGQHDQKLHSTGGERRKSLLTNANFKCDGNYAVEEHAKCSESILETEIETAAENIARVVVKVSRFSRDLVGMYHWTDYYGLVDPSWEIQRVRDFGETYDSVFRTAHENSHFWNKGDGLYNNIDMLFKSTLGYAGFVKEIYEESENRIIKLNSKDTGIFDLLKQLKEFNITLTEEQQMFLRNYDVESEVLLEFLEHVRASTEEIKKNTRDSEEKFRTFGRRLNNDRSRFKTLYIRIDPILQSLRKHIENKVQVIAKIKMEFKEKQQGQVLDKNFTLNVEETKAGEKKEAVLDVWRVLVNHATIPDYIPEIILNTPHALTEEYTKKMEIVSNNSNNSLSNQRNISVSHKMDIPVSNETNISVNNGTNISVSDERNNSVNNETNILVNNETNISISNETLSNSTIEVTVINPEYIEKKKIPSIEKILSEVYSGNFTATDMNYTIATLAQKAATNGYPVIINTVISSMRYSNLTEGQTEYLKNLTVLVKAMAEEEYSQNYIDSLKVHKDEIFEFLDHLKIVIQNLNEIIPNIKIISSLFSNTENDLSNIISTTKSENCQAEIRNFIKLMISNLQCYWNDGKLVTFEAFVENVFHSERVTETFFQQLRDSLADDRQFQQFKDILNNKGTEDEQKTSLMEIIGSMNILNGEKFMAVLEQQDSHEGLKNSKPTVYNKLSWVYKEILDVRNQPYM